MGRRIRFAALLAFVAGTMLLFGACGDDEKATPTAPVASRSAAPVTTAAADPTAGAASSALTLTSDAFKNGGTIPVKYSCSGDATSPALAWSGAPAGTQSFTLIVHDPDAPLPGGFTHWIVIDLPASTTSLQAAVPAGKLIGGGGSQLIDYRGMCPPVGAAAHRYQFRLYALDIPLGANAGTTKDSVEAAMQGHILAQTEMVGLFGR